jgi:hypothetical protein
MADYPQLPLDDLKRAAGDSPDAHAALDALHGELQAPKPDPTRIAQHAENVRGIDALTGPFERWYLDPRVQTFLADLNAAGL